MAGKNEPGNTEPDNNEPGNNEPDNIASKSDKPDGIGYPLPLEKEPKPAKPTAKMFACTACGASITIKYPGAAMAVVCNSCNSTIDVTSEAYRILSTYVGKTTFFKPDIPLGARGKLKGKTWEVIGYLVREASDYFWSEYLLFNPYYGYRWLVEDKGYWNFVTTIKRKPDTISINRYPVKGQLAKLDGKSYQIYNYGNAKVKYVLGEFYWRVMVGSSALTADYIDPPRMLSAEKDDNEVVWSLAEYMDADEIHKAFKVESKFPFQSGVPATKPPTELQASAKIGFLCTVFCIFITCAQVYFTADAPQSQLLRYDGIFTPNQKKADITTPVFTVTGGPTNIVIDLTAPVNNSWFYVGGEMVNDEDGTSYPFEKSVEYYCGSDSDGFWSEGSTRAQLGVSSVPSGKYYLNIDTESGDFRQARDDQYTITVSSGYAIYDNYWWTLLALILVPIYAFIAMRSVESSRWSNSDFSPYPDPSVYIGSDD
ncbi:hypothetical protein BH11CYA1_BH11CYA1_19790 [soil metagenome]